MRFYFDIIDGDLCAGKVEGDFTQGYEPLIGEVVDLTLGRAIVGLPEQLERMMVEDFVTWSYLDRSGTSAKLCWLIVTGRTQVLELVEILERDFGYEFMPFYEQYC